MRMFKSSSSEAVVFLFLILVLTFLVYLPGLHGGFLFDDFPNLEDLGTYGGVVDFNTLRAFVLGGFAGPTGRPLSLLSFLLNDNTWPSQAYSFKLTNVWIHLLVGLALCWATLQLLRLYGVTESKAVWIAVLSTSIWLLHPYFVSTTLYVVQRMAQLAALFGFAGLAGYLYGRLLLTGRPRAGYIWMTLSVGLGTLLATLSKENGALLPLLIVVIDFCQPKGTAPRPAKWWSLFVIWLPSLVLVGALARMINFSPDLWPERPFNQPQRLLSEARILWEYLFHLYIPQIEGRGLFQDGYKISQGWTSPVSTLYSVVGLLILFVSALVLKKRWPFYSLAILFFFAAHLMESSVVGLELYFEHRNYVAAAFLFLPVALGIVLLAEKVRIKVPLVIGAILFTALVVMTLLRVDLWKDTDKLELYWAVSTPDSPRAHNAIAAFLVRQGRVDEANAHLQQAMISLPRSSLLTIRLLLQKVYAGTADERDFSDASEKLGTQPFDAQAVQGLRSLVDKVLEHPVSARYVGYSIHLVDVMELNSNYRMLPVFQRLASYLKAKLYLADGNVDKAMAEYSLAMSRYVDTEASLMMLAELARAGYQERALELLPQARAIYEQQPARNMRRTSAEYDDEFARLEKNLLLDVAAKKAQEPSHE